MISNSRNYVLYVLRTPSNKFKVGISSNFKSRLRSFHTNCSESFEIYLCIEVGDSKSEVLKLERRIHNNLRHKKTHGEWFQNLNESELNYLKDLEQLYFFSFDF